MRPTPPELPPEINHQDLVRALHSLGIPIENLRSFEATAAPRQVTVRYLQRDENRLPVLIDDEAAEHTVEIPVRG